MIFSSGTMFFIRNTASFFSFCCWVENAASPAPGGPVATPGGVSFSSAASVPFPFQTSPSSSFTCYCPVSASLLLPHCHFTDLSGPWSGCCAAVLATRPRLRTDVPAEPLASTELQACRSLTLREPSRAAWCLRFVLSLSSASA